MANAPVAYVDSGKPGNPAYNVCRNVPTFNGVSQLVTADRLAGIDLDDLYIELEGYFDLMSQGTLWSQNTNASPRAFQISANSSGTGFNIVLGGSTTSVTVGASVRQDAALWAVRLAGTSATVYKNGVQIGSATTVIGATREPTAIFRIGARGNGSDILHSFFITGKAKNQKVWTGGDRTTGTLDLDMPLDDSFNNNPTARNLAGNNGVFINMTSAAWSEVCE